MDAHKLKCASLVCEEASFLLKLWIHGTFVGSEQFFSKKLTTCAIHKRATKQPKCVAGQVSRFLPGHHRRIAAYAVCTENEERAVSHFDHLDTKVTNVNKTDKKESDKRQLLIFTI